MRFNGRAIEAYAGDTAASALLANGIHFVGRSFKYHRPRGIFSHGDRRAQRPVFHRSGRGSCRSEQSGFEHRGGRWPVHRLAEPLAVARLRCGGDQRRAVADFRRRLLLQDLHVAAVLLGQALRAVDSCRGRPRPVARRARSRPLSARPRALRCAGRRRRPGWSRCCAGGVGRRQAGHSRRRAGRDGRGSAARDDLHHRRHIGLGVARRRACHSELARQRHLAAAHDGLRLLQSQPHRPGAAGDGPSAAAAPRLAARASVAGARRRGRAGDGRARAPARLRRQRSSRHHAGREPARVRQSLRRGAGTAGGDRHIGRFRLHGCGRSQGGGPRGRRSSICAGRAIVHRRPRPCVRPAARS